MKATLIKSRNREEWLQYRTHGIGASEVGTILGVNPFQTPYKLWLKKTGREQPQEENTAMRMGHRLEQVVAEEFEFNTGSKVIKASAGDWLYIHPEKDYFRASPDRFFWESDAKHNDANKGVLECKSTQMDMDKIPLSWFCQLQWNMFVIGKEHGALAWLRMGREFGTKAYNIDPDFCAMAAEKVERFWLDNIVGGQEPAMADVSDVLTKWNKSESGTQLVATDELLKAYESLKQINQCIEVLKKDKEKAESAIKIAMCGNEALVNEKGDTLVTWRTAKSTMKFQEDQFKKENPDMWERYTAEKEGSRRFLVK